MYRHNEMNYCGKDCKREMEECRKHDESFMRPMEYSEQEKYVKVTNVMTTWHKEPVECKCNNGCRR